MSKKINFAPKPKTSPINEEESDKWVENRQMLPSVASVQKIPYKRLTLDIPEDLHQTIKIACAKRKTKMADEIREILRDHYQKPLEDSVL